MDYLILDSKKWDFQIRIILIQIKCFEQLAPDVTLFLTFLSHVNTAVSVFDEKSDSRIVVL